MPFIDTPSLRFHLRTFGDPHGVPMLLLHGSHGSSRWWEPLTAILPDSIYALAPDLRGCGRSEGGSTGYEIEEQARDLLALAEALALKDVDLVGHSSGAAVALELALMRPDLISTLILVAPVPAEGVFTPLDVFTLLDQMRHDRTLHARALASMMPTYAAVSGADHEPEARDPDFFRLLVDDAQHMDPAAFTATATALGRWNRFGDVQRLTLPTVIVWGDRDTIVNRDEVTRTLLALPGANNLEVMRGVGHSPMIEAPARLAELILAFITEDFEQFDEVKARADDSSVFNADGNDVDQAGVDGGDA